MSNDVRMTFTPKEVSQMIRNVFKVEHAKQMSECIIEIINEQNEGALQIVLKAAMGADMSLAYKEGDEVFCKQQALSTWRWDKPKMKEAGIIDEDGCLKGTIVKAQKYRQNPYQFKYKYLEENVTEIKSSTDDIAERYIEGMVEVFPGDEEIELLNPEDNGEEVKQF